MLWHDGKLPMDNGDLDLAEDEDDAAPRSQAK
jgi:hypothetical protein